jgi:hypothetical protein
MTLRSRYNALRAEIIESLDKSIPAPEYKDSEYVMLVLHVEIETHCIGNIAALIKRRGDLYLLDESDDEHAIEDFHESIPLIELIEAMDKKQYIITE